MNFEEMLDDEFKEAPIGVFDNIENIFPIIGCECNNIKEDSLGTGFFINDVGVFLTAGHVLKDKSKSYYAIIKNEKYKFKVLFSEYPDNGNQEPPNCCDLAICQIIGLKLNIPIVYSFVCNSLEDKKIFYSGYQGKNSQNIISSVETFNKYHAYLYKFSDNDEKLNDAERKLIVNGIEFFDKRAICDNVKSFKCKRKVNGMSGGPVYYDKNVFGMLIGDSYILSEYIVEKLNELKIDYKSHNKNSDEKSNKFSL